MEFVKGKWYKGSKNNYVKFSHFEEGVGYNLVYFSESINNGTHRNFTGVKEDVNFWFSPTVIEFALNNPVTDEEILKLLPVDINGVSIDIHVEFRQKTINIIESIEMKFDPFYVGKFADECIKEIKNLKV